MIKRHIHLFKEMDNESKYSLSILNLTDPKNSHEFQIILTGQRKKVLELGPATGYISKILKENNCTITAIEQDHKDAKLASQIVDKMIVGDIEKLNLKKELGTEKFDVILAGDFLEHLQNPEILLKELILFLKSTGYIVCSIPNITHGSIRLKLLDGQFNYTKTGLLDRTHLKFYSLKTILELFESSGYSIVELKKAKVDIFAADGINIDTLKIHGDLVQALLNDPSATTFQYIFRAIPSSNTHNKEILDDEDLHPPKVVTKYLKDNLDDYFNQIDVLQKKNQDQITQKKITSKKDIEIESLQKITSKKDIEIESLQKITSKKDIEIESLQTAVENYQKTIIDIHQSFVFRMFHKYDKTIGKIIPIRPKKYIKSAKYQLTTKEQETHTKKALDTVLEKKDIICFPIINWDFRYQRPQHIISEFAKNGHRVFYLTVNLRQLQKPYEIKTLANNIFQIELDSPKFFDIYKDKFNELLISKLINKIKELQKDLKLDAISFVEFPTWGPLVLELQKQLGYPIIFDCLDDFTEFDNVKKEREKEEKILLRKSDLVLVTSSYLLKKVMKETHKSLFLPNAGEFEHFNKTKDSLLSEYKKPIIGYFGSISDWFDTSLIEYLANSRSEFTFVMIGYTFGADIRKLQKFPNIHFLGERPYSELPKYLHDFDVCLIPFKRIPLTEATHPVKIYEYFAAGKPVVASSMTELIPMADMCYLAKDKEDFLKKLDLAVNEKDEAVTKKRIKFASENTWENRFETLYNELKKIDSFNIEHHS